MEKANERQPTQREIATKTLENKALQSVLSSNQILEKQSLYGQLAVNGAKNTYNENMNSEGVRKVRDALYKEKLEKGKEKGVYGVPSINDYDVSMFIREQIDENKLKLSLGDLEAIVKKLGKDFGYNFKLPTELRNYIPKKLHEKIQIAAIKARKKEINPGDVLNEKEMKALGFYDFLSKAYNHGVALKTCNYFGDLNALGEKMMEKMYGSEPKESKE